MARMLQCPVCAQCAPSTALGTLLLLAVLDEAQSLMSKNSDALTRIEQAKYSLQAAEMQISHFKEQCDISNNG
jgi:hypothetical protein